MADNMRIQSCKTTARKDSFYPRTIKEWNTLPNLKCSRRTVIFLPVYKISSLKITPPKTPNSGQFSYPLPNIVSFLFEEVINLLYQMPLFFCLPQGLIYSDFLILKTQ
jgi:hypothetical protein